MKFYFVAFVAVSVLAVSGCVVSKPSLHAEDRAGLLVKTFGPADTPMLVLENIPEKTECTITILHLPDRSTVRTIYRQSGRDNNVPGLDLDRPVNPFHRLLVSDLSGLSAGNYVAELWINGKRQDTQDFSVKES
jgi:hypothetical protein